MMIRTKIFLNGALVVSNRFINLYQSLNGFVRIINGCKI